jgi:hypothetical protein
MLWLARFHTISSDRRRWPDESPNQDARLATAIPVLSDHLSFTAHQLLPAGPASAAAEDLRLARGVLEVR